MNCLHSRIPYQNLHPVSTSPSVRSTSLQMSAFSHPPSRESASTSLRAFWPSCPHHPKTPILGPSPSSSFRGPQSLVDQGKKKHININKFSGLSRDWVGAKNLFMCFFRVIPYGGEKTHKQNPPQIPGQSRENFVYVISSLCVCVCFFFFFGPQLRNAR